MSEVETTTKERSAIEVPGAAPTPPPSKPGPLPAGVQAATCLHKWVSLDRLVGTGSVLQAGAGGPGVEKILYVFFCERCITLTTASLNLGRPAG